MDWKKLYKAAHEKNLKEKCPQAYADGHYFEPTIPIITKANGLTTLVINYLNWTGNFAERTNNMGTPIKKKIPKFNIISGKLEHIDGGLEWRKGNGTKGTSDIKGHIKTAKSPYPIPIYIEVKIGKDKQSEEQKTYEQKVTQTGAFYIIVRTPEDFFKFLENI